MQQPDLHTWDLTPAVDLLKALSFSEKYSSVTPPVSSTPHLHETAELLSSRFDDFSLGLGNFDLLWDFLGQSRHVKVGKSSEFPPELSSNEQLPSDVNSELSKKGVRSRDEVDGADLEDNADPAPLQTAASSRTRKRAARRAATKRIVVAKYHVERRIAASSRTRKRAARRAATKVIDVAKYPGERRNAPDIGTGAESEDTDDNVDSTPLDCITSLRSQNREARRALAKAMIEVTKYPKGKGDPSDTGTGAESGEELEQLRRSPDRIATIIQGIVVQGGPRSGDIASPPTSPSPPKRSTLASKKDWPVSTPFHRLVGQLSSPSLRRRITPTDKVSPEARKKRLIAMLSQNCPEEKIFLSNSGLVDPHFIPLNVSNAGIHVFVDISNISIGFHDCVKLVRDIPVSTRIRRIPLCFHKLSLILERGRPAAKRVLVGSDKFPVVQQAKNIGYETNILERVHKAKEWTPRQKKYSGMSSGSETNTKTAPEKWVEQAVDEILHLKILESLIDAEMPSTIVLATGDAAEAEYSGGFMKMVERALEKGWMVELVSFRLNTSSAYQRAEFRSKWGPMFKWIKLDDYVEQLIDVEE